MSAVILYIAASLDGYIADSQGGVSWLEPFEQAGEDYGYTAFYRSLDAVIVGRITYEQSLTFGEWPYRGVATYVVSHRPVQPPAGHHVEAYSGSLPELVSKLKDRFRKDIWLVGGAQLVAAFLRDNLIDQLILTVIPVMLGSGIPLFVEGSARRSLTLNAVNHYPNGIVQLTYHFSNVGETLA